MAPLDSTARKQAEEPAPPYRAAPHNIEAEQALLGAILVNNEALYRVSDFLEPPHFFEPIHQQIYDIARSLIRTGKLASPVTLKTFLPARDRHRRVDARPVPRPPRRRSNDHHQRGGLRTHGLRPRDPARADQDRRGHGQRRLRRAGRFRPARPDRGRRAPPVRARRGRPLRRRVPESSKQPSPPPSTWRRAPTSARDKLSGLATGLKDLDSKMGGLQSSDLIIVAGRPGMGKTALATNIAYNVARAWRGEVRADGHIDTVNGGHRGLLLARNVGRAARDPHHRRAERHSVQHDPARRHQRARLREDQGRRSRAAALAVLHRRDRRTDGGAACRPRAAPQAAKRPRSRWSSTTSSCCKDRAGARRKTACRR